MVWVDQKYPLSLTASWNDHEKLLIDCCPPGGFIIQNFFGFWEIFKANSIFCLGNIMHSSRKSNCFFPNLINIFLEEGEFGV